MTFIERFPKIETSTVFLANPPHRLPDQDVCSDVGFGKWHPQWRGQFDDW